MSERQLFNRAWSVTIGKPGEKGLIYRDLKVVFEVEKSSAVQANKAKIAIYNLNNDSRKKFVKGFIIRLDAGYEGLLETLYIGDVFKVTHERKGPDIVSTFECLGGKQLVSAHFDASYPAGTAAVVIIKDLARALKVNIGTVIGIQNLTYGSGFVASGSVKTVLTKILEKQKLEWSIQNGALQIIPIKNHTGESAVVLSKNTGMIGIPSEGTDSITVESLLNPKLVPGRVIQLISATINGFFKIRKVNLDGDTHGSKWNVKCEATPVKLTQNLPQNQGLNFKTVPGAT